MYLKVKCFFFNKELSVANQMAPSVSANHYSVTSVQSGKEGTNVKQLPDVWAVSYNREERFTAEILFYTVVFTCICNDKVEGVISI